MNDMVHQPPHYTSHPSGVECRRLTVEHNFNVGNAIKYGYRWKDKGDPLENLQKMDVYLGFEVERLKEYATYVETFRLHSTGSDYVDSALDLLLSHYHNIYKAKSYIENLISILQEDVSS